MENSKDLITGFFAERFGRLVAEELVQTNLKKIGITNLKALSSKEQMQAGQKIIENVSREFYSHEQIENLKTLYLLRYSLNEAAKKVQQTLKTPCEIIMERPQTTLAGQSQAPAEILSQEDSQRFIFQSRNTLDGTAVFSVAKNDAVSLAKILMLTMTGAIPGSNELDNEKISTISKFLHILIPSFSEMAYKAFDEKLVFNTQTDEQFKEAYFHNTQFLWPPLVITSEIFVQIGDTKSPATVVLLVRDTSGKFRTLLEHANIKTNPFEQTPGRNLVKPTEDTKKDVEVLFRLLGIQTEQLQKILDKMNKDFKDFTEHDLETFHNEIVQMKKITSENMKASLKSNLENLIRIE